MIETISICVGIVTFLRSSSSTGDVVLRPQKEIPLLLADRHAEFFHRGHFIPKRNASLWVKACIGRVHQSHFIGF